MNKPYFKLAIILPAILGALFSCTAPIDIHTDDAPVETVIYGVLTNDTTQQAVHVSKSAPYFSDVSNAEIRNAAVSVAVAGGNTYSFSESSTQSGTYLSNMPFATVAGTNYTLKVTFTENGQAKSYQASSQVPALVAFDSVNVRPQEIVGKKGYGLYLYGLEPSSTDYYVGEMKVNDVLVTPTIGKLYTFDDQFFNGAQLKGQFLAYFPDASRKSDFSEEQQKDRIFLKSGDKVDFAIMRVEQGYYDFITQAQRQLAGENPFFGGPSSNITTNIPGGSGYFAAYAKKWYRTYVP